MEPNSFQGITSTWKRDGSLILRSTFKSFLWALAKRFKLMNGMWVVLTMALFHAVVNDTKSYVPFCVSHERTWFNRTSCLQIKCMFSRIEAVKLSNPSKHQTSSVCFSYEHKHFLEFSESFAKGKFELSTCCLPNYKVPPLHNAEDVKGRLQIN